MTLFACRPRQGSAIHTQAIIRNLLESHFRKQGKERETAGLAKHLVEQANQNAPASQTGSKPHQLTLALLALLEGLSLPLSGDETTAIMDCMGQLLRDLKDHRDDYKLNMLDAVMLENANRRLRENREVLSRSTNNYRWEPSPDL